VVSDAETLVALAILNAEPSRARDPPPTDWTEFETPSVNVLPLVSVGVEGGLWLYHPSAKARTFPEATFEVNARPHEEELQFEV